MNNYNYPNYQDPYINGDICYQDPYINQNMQYQDLQANQNINYQNQYANVDAHFVDQTRDINYYENNESLKEIELPKNYDVMKGYLRGNLFDTLYEPYKGYNPIEPVIKNEKEALLLQVRAYMFAVTELNLYLDTNPTDRDAIRLFNEYQNAEKELCHQYVSKYGPMTVYSEMNDNMSWVWNNNPWPWEVANV